MKISKWNFDADDNGLMVCKNDHPRSQDFDFERLSPHETLQIINRLRAQCLEYEALLKL